jgi:hypothetical protein
MDPEELDTRTLVLLLLGHLRERVMTHPVSTLASAASVGYMLGWSMPSALYRTVGSLALRAVAMNVFSSLVGPEDDEGEYLEDERPSNGHAAAGGSRSDDTRPTDPYVA